MSHTSSSATPTDFAAAIFDGTRSPFASWPEMIRCSPNRFNVEAARGMNIRLNARPFASDFT